MTFDSKATLFDLIDLKYNLEELLHHKVDVVSDGGIRDTFRRMIEHEVIEL